MTKTTKIIFITSLILNILLVGFIAGNFFGDRKFKPRPHFGMNEDREERIIRSLPESKQEKAREILARLRELRGKNFAQTKLLFDDIEKIVVAKDFEEEKFLQAFERFDNSFSSSKKESNKIIAKFLSELESEDRVKLMNEIKKQNHFLKRDLDQKHNHKKD